MFKTELEISELDFIDKIVATSWLLVGNSIIVKRVIQKVYKEYSRGKKILDIGCGTGNFSLFLNSLGKVFGVDRSYEALLHCRKKGIKQILQADAPSLPFKNDCFDTIILLDVIEHIDDDKALVSETHRLLKNGGHVFIMVPAFNVLWGSHDVRFYHKRRYTKTSISRLASLVDFKIEKIIYLHPHIFPFMLFYRYIDRRRKGFGKRHDNILLPKIINDFLTWTIRIENLFLERINERVDN